MKDGALVLTVSRKCLLSSHMILALSHPKEINTQASGGWHTQMMHSTGEMCSNALTSYTRPLKDI